MIEHWAWDLSAKAVIVEFVRTCLCFREAAAALLSTQVFKHVFIGLNRMTISKEQLPLSELLTLAGCERVALKPLQLAALFVLSQGDSVQGCVVADHLGQFVDVVEGTGFKARAPESPLRE